MWLDKACVKRSTGREHVKECSNSCSGRHS
jgi:hypothetical protein